MTLSSHVASAEEEIVFTIGLPVGHELFKAGEKVLAAISNRMGEKLKLISIPSKRSGMLLENNAIHAELVRSGEYQARVPFAIKVVEPIVDINHYAYSIKTDIVIDGWDSLKTYSSVALRGNWIIEMHTKGHQITWVDSISAGVQFLKMVPIRVYYQNRVCDLTLSYLRSIVNYLRVNEK